MPENKKIAYFFWSLCVGGNENAILKIIKVLASEGWEVWTLAYTKNSNFRGQYKKDYCRYSKVSFFKNNPERVIDFLVKNEIRLLHLTWGDFTIAQIIKKRDLDIKVVVSTTNSLPEKEAKLGIGNFVREVQVPHERDIELVTAKDPTLKNKVICISNGVDTAQLSLNTVSKKAINKLKKKYGLEGYKVIGVIGNIRRVKNYGLLLDVLSVILRSGAVRAKLVIVGSILEKEEWHNLQKRVKALHLERNVAFAGLQFDTPLYLSLFDVYAMSSLGTESCPNAVLEAMSMELPVVAADNVGLSGLIEDGLNGYVVKKNLAEDMTKRIAELLSSEEKRVHFGKISRKLVQERFPLSRMVEEYRMWYQKVLEET